MNKTALKYGHKLYDITTSDNTGGVSMVKIEDGEIINPEPNCLKPPKQDLKTAIAEILFNSPHNLGWNNAKHLSDKILSLMSNHLELQAQSIINILGTECQECRAFMEGETASYKGYFPVVKIIDKLKESLRGV